ncbi:Terpene synthase [Macleaya cordata]|uniref:Terpene synthase n=1 Tax=Macleaya cordata TaxID=56857 RepID=A0A200QMI8_MACCD|nr:Terpene synthase [Macleaya cordata]
MALHLQLLTPSTSSSSSSTSLPISRRVARRAPNINSHVNLRSVKCFSIPVKYDPKIPRRSEHYQYQPTIWDYDFVESLTSNYAGETYMDQMEKRKKDVRLMLEKALTPLAQLELIDRIQRLGIGYLFEEEIKECLQNLYNKTDDAWMKDNLYATALSFRLFRQYGFQVSQDVFKGFRQAKGDFKESIAEDIKGMLSLYEAAHLVSEGENILEQAIAFTTRHLKHLTSSGNSNIDPNLANQVSHSLEIPLHWRMQRSEARWFMDAYELQKDTNPILLELAKLNFNMVQATHQKDLRNMSRWWRNLGVAMKLNFARDRLVESFLWSMGIAVEPQYGRCREWLTKVMNFVLIIDDIYDVYGSLEELELFTDAVEKWDTKAMEKLPYYMKICFLALYNTTNEMAFETLKEQGWDILPYLTKSWANFIKAMLVEAKWCNQGYTPSLKEYLDNGWLSSSGSVFLVHAFFATKQNIRTDVLQALENNHNLLYCASMMFRLSNDLATSSAELERGDVASSIHCHMKETNASEKEAREHVRGLIVDTWKKMNGSICDSPFNLPFINMVLNLARTALFIYQYGDGLGVEDTKSKDHVLSLIVNPVQIETHKPLVNNLSHLRISHLRYLEYVCRDAAIFTRLGNQWAKISIYGSSLTHNLIYIMQGEAYMDRMAKGKKDVRVMLEKAATPLAQLELIDVIQRLGLSYLFEEEIKRSLQNIHTTDVFNGYCKHEKGAFKESITEVDVKGILSLYEAAHLVSEGENILEQAVAFTRRHLKHLIRSGNNNIDPNLANQLSRSLEIPLHWRMQRSEARWFIDAYESQEDMNPLLLELAKLDFNMVQTKHQNELKNMSRWWSRLGIATKLTFARDRLVESFLSSIGITWEPQYGRCREWLTKVLNFVLVIDDIYDVYGSLEELELFTNAVERWDTKETQKLPHYMKICFLALYNTANEMAFEILKEKDCDVLPYLTKSWANFIKAMLVEAKWCDNGYTPSLEEYLDNGWLSSSGIVFLIHAFFATNQNINTNVLLALENNHNLLYYASMMCRLSNDLATSSAELARGDVASSIHCHMMETKASEKDAREHIRGLIMDTWKKMNGSIRDSPFELSFVNLALNLARTALFIYQYGDGLGVEVSKSKDHVLSMIVHPVQTEG